MAARQVAKGADVQAALLARAAACPATIVLSEGEDPRMVSAALTVCKLGIATVILLGQADSVRAELARQGGAETEGLQVEDPGQSPRLRLLADRLLALRAAKGMTAEMARSEAAKPLNFAALLVEMGFAEGTVGGAVATTSDTVRAALQIIGPAKGCKTVSSFFLMILPERPGAPERGVVFSDCGLVVDPDPPDLAEIAMASAQSFQSLMGEAARVAMLSFSTHGSAKHPAADKVLAALAEVKRRAPDLMVDGELQFDAAFDPEVGAKKAKGSAVAGQANVFVFPNLDAGNIGYKIAQRIGGAVALGPVLQGLAKPANDLSRGCTAGDIVLVTAITVLQAAALRAGEGK